MSLLRAFLLSQGSAWGASLPIEYKILVNVSSVFSLCTNPIEELNAQITSVYVVAIMEEVFLTASITSVYDLSTAPT